MREYILKRNHINVWKMFFSERQFKISGYTYQQNGDEPLLSISEPERHERVYTRERLFKRAAT